MFSSPHVSSVVLFAAAVSLFCATKAVAQGGQQPLTATIMQNNVQSDTIQWANFPAVRTADTASYLSPNERRMIHELNMARLYPKEYAPFVRFYIERQRREMDLSKGMIGTALREVPPTIANGQPTFVTDTFRLVDTYRREIEAAEELIVELNTMHAVGRLLPNSCMYSVAALHATDDYERGYANLRSPDGTMPFDRIPHACTELKGANEVLISNQLTARQAAIALLVDGQSQERVRRRIVLNPQWHFVAPFEEGPVGADEHCWILDWGY